MKTKILPFLLCFSVIIALIIYPDKYLIVVYNGIKLFAVNVLPALLPFFFFTGLLSNLGAGEIFAKAFNRPCRSLYNTSGIGGYVYITSMLSGYPVGAKVISDLVKDQKISPKDASVIMTYTSTSGPLFIVGTVGSIMLNNKLAGMILLVCHYLSALINGLIYRNKTNTSSLTLLSPKSVDNVLSESIYSAVTSVSIAGAYVAIFYTVGAILTDIGVIPLIANLLSTVVEYDVANGIAFGLIEMTGGCLMLSKSSSIYSIPAICAIISFGGLSVTLQSMTFLEKAKVKPTKYLLSKITQSMIAFFVCLLVIKFIYPL